MLVLSKRLESRSVCVCWGQILTFAVDLHEIRCSLFLETNSVKMYLLCSELIPVSKRCVIRPGSVP